VTESRYNANTSVEVGELEQKALAAYLSGAQDACEELWTRAHTECLHTGDIERAVRNAFWLALDLFNRGEWARGNGWLSRGLHLVESADESASLGLLLVLVSRNCLKQGDVEAAHRAARRAVDIAARFEQPDLTVFSRLASALVRLRERQFTEASGHFDEIMVGVTVDEVSPIAVGVVYCAVIDGCRSFFDLSRAREWTTALSQWYSVRPDAAAFRGKCLVNRSEIMRLSGEWTDALAEAERACEWTASHENSFRYPVGAAFYELAEIHRLRGNVSASEAAYRRASEHGHPVEPGLTLLQFMEGKTEAAAVSIRRLLSESQNDVLRASVLHAAVEILIASGDIETAQTAADELAAMTKRYSAPALRALAAAASGAIHLAKEDGPPALKSLREAWMIWQDLDAPYEAARVRLLLGQVCQKMEDHTAAELEFDSARRVFDRLAAQPDITRADVLSQRVRKAESTPLTARELQVIELIAKGETNRTIARQLSISERTVDRHVSNILLKLNLPSRAAATAYAFQHDLI
jgi:DNA-binding CsgD family transcriptional regulator